MRTELRVQGANCPLCLNDMVEQLRSVDGVSAVGSSIRAGCIAVDHDDLDPEALATAVRARLHGVDMASNEIVMDSIEPIVMQLHCEHAVAGSESEVAGVVPTETERET